MSQILVPSIGSRVRLRVQHLSPLHRTENLTHLPISRSQSTDSRRTEPAPRRARVRAAQGVAPDEIGVGRDRCADDFGHGRCTVSGGAYISDKPDHIGPLDEHEGARRAPRVGRALYYVEHEQGKAWRSHGRPLPLHCVTLGRRFDHNKYDLCCVLSRSCAHLISP